MVHLENVIKIYRTGRSEVTALDSINLRIEKGEFITVCGPSGCGKTTLLMTIAGLQRPTGGSASVHNKDIYNMSMHARSNFRARNIGFIFQMFHLVPYLTVAENIVIAGTAAGNHSRKTDANELLEKFGLSHRASHKPSELSAGEKQRTAIARAVFNHPKIILADEPTGNLDPDNAAVVLGYLADYHRSGGTVVLVTHGPQVEQVAGRTIYMRNGRIENSTDVAART